MGACAASGWLWLEVREYYASSWRYDLTVNAALAPEGAPDVPPQARKDPTAMGQLEDN
jgi:hypothetical protein